MAYQTNLTQGARGEDVKALQTALNASGANLKVDGIFGGLTQAAVNGYQAPQTQNTNMSGGVTNTPSQAPDFMSQIQAKLLEQSGIISSTNSTLESKINDAIAGVGSARDSSNAALNISYDRQKGYALDKASSDLTAGRAAGAGGGVMNMAALRELTKTTDKNLNDLEQRKQELILQNDAQAASQVAGLQMKALEFQQQAQQQVFSNLLGMGNYALEADKQNLARSSQSFQEKSAISSIGLQYGVSVLPGDTLESITQKAMATGFVTKQHALELAKLQSEINANNAQAAKVLKGDTVTNVSDGALSTLAARWNTLVNSGQNINDNKEMQNILGNFSGGDQQSRFYTAIANEAVNATKAQVSSTTTTPATQQPGFFAKLGANFLGETYIPSNGANGTFGFVKDPQTGQWMTQQAYNIKYPPRKK